MVAELRCELFPADFDACFYLDVLGFDLVREQRASPLPYVALARGAVALGLAQRGEVAEAGQRRPPVDVGLVLEGADLTAAHQQVVAAGWPLVQDLTSRAWGLVDVAVLDPVGYCWRITTGADATS